MNSQFLKDHLIDFEVVAALCIASVLRFGFDGGWLFSILSGLSAFVLIPLVLLVAFHLRARFYAKPRMASTEATRLKKPTQCVLWENPALIDRRQDQPLERLVTYVDDSHLMRQLLKCHECGQLYFFEFYEEIDWKNGNDSQYCTYIPVDTDAEIETLKCASTFELLRFFPRLQLDSTARWIGK